jgi:hypothetical protein
MLYVVLKLKMSPEAVAEVNARGWRKSDEGAAYMRMRSANASNPDLASHALAAALMGLYHHGLTVDAPSIDAVFDYDNGAPYSTGVVPSYHCKGLPSMSVGDIVMDSMCAHLCCDNGWVRLPQHAEIAIASMEARIREQRPNALNAAA